MKRQQGHIGQAIGSGLLLMLWLWLSMVAYVHQFAVDHHEHHACGHHDDGSDGAGWQESHADCLFCHISPFPSLLAELPERHFERPQAAHVHRPLAPHAIGLIRSTEHSVRGPPAQA